MDAPTLEEAPIQLEGPLLDSLRLPPRRRGFLAEVTATRVLEGDCDAQGRLITRKLKVFGRAAGSGEFCLRGPVIGPIVQGVGRSAIRD